MEITRKHIVKANVAVFYNRKALDRLRVTFLLQGNCLLYTSDAADDLTRVDLGGRRIIKKNVPPGCTESIFSKNKKNHACSREVDKETISCRM